MISAERKLVVTAAWTLTVLGAWSIAQRAAQAEEVDPPRKLRVEMKVTGPSIPMLSRIPYLGRLFAEEESECCEGKVQIVEMFERVGVDFEPASREVCAHDPSKLCCEKCDVDLCPACPASGQVAAAAKASCKACNDTSCSVALSECCKHSECVVQTAATEHECVEQQCHKTECVVNSRMADLVAENTALAAALEAKEEMLELQTKMWERFAMLMAEKVQLQAQLEFSEKLLAERLRTMEKLQELAQENSRLKNMVELTTMRHQAEQTKHELAQENQQLKARVAELEIARREPKTEVRVTEKPRVFEWDGKSIKELTEKLR